MPPILPTGTGGRGTRGRAKGGVSSQRVRRATPENPQFSLNDPEAWEAFGALKSDSGVRITPEIALTDSPWWRGINLVATTVAKVPLVVYERAGEGKIRATGHPAYPLLHHEPNAEGTAFIFWQTLMGHVLTTGNGYAYVHRDGAGRPLELIQLDPDKCWPVRVNGVLSYAVTAKGQTRAVDPSNILHLKGWGYDGLVGYSVLEKAREELGMGVAARKHGTSVFKNGALIGVILEHPTTMSEEAQKRFLKTFERRHSGPDNAFRTAIVEEGMKVSTAKPFSAREAQLLELRGLHIREIANFIGVPPHKLGDNSRQAYASMEEENQSFLDDCIDGWLVMIEQEARKKLLTEQEKKADTHLVEFLRAALVRADLESRYNAHRIALAGVPFRTINEVRADENENPLPGGSVLIIPISVKDPDAPADDQGTKSKPKGLPKAGGKDAGGAGGDAQEGEADANRRVRLHDGAAQVLRDTRRRMLRRLAELARRAAKEPKGFTAWLEGLGANQGPLVRDAMASPALVVALLEGRDANTYGSEAAAALVESVRSAADRVYSSAKPAEFEGALERALATLEDAA